MSSIRTLTPSAPFSSSGPSDQKGSVPLVHFVLDEYSRNGEFTESSLLRFSASQSTPPFFWTPCQVGAEPALKDEVSRIAPQLKSAYLRPGFVTWKWSGSNSPFESRFSLDSVFARMFALSLGRTNREQTLEVLNQLHTLAASTPPKDPSKTPVFWAFSRDEFFPGDEPKDFDPKRPLRPIQKESAALQSLWSGVPSPQQPVLSLIWISDDEFYWGLHFHSTLQPDYSGGKWSAELPPHAPSRAYLKLSEAIARFHIPMKPEQRALEVGSSPGGACAALLEKGLRVVGVDPAQMDPVLLKNPRLHWIQKKAADVLPSDLKRVQPDLSFQWLLLDMNAEPNISIPHLLPLFERVQAELLGVVLTLKLNHWKITQELPYLIEELKKCGLGRIRMKQLSTNRQEICFYALTRKGTLLH